MSVCVCVLVSSTIFIIVLFIVPQFFESIAFLEWLPFHFEQFRLCSAFSFLLFGTQHTHTSKPNTKKIRFIPIKRRAFRSLKIDPVILRSFFQMGICNVLMWMKAAVLLLIPRLFQMYSDWKLRLMYNFLYLWYYQRNHMPNRIKEPKTFDDLIFSFLFRQFLPSKLVITDFNENYSIFSLIWNTKYIAFEIQKKKQHENLKWKNTKTKNMCLQRWY